MGLGHRYHFPRHCLGSLGLPSPSGTNLQEPIGTNYQRPAPVSGYFPLQSRFNTGTLVCLTKNNTPSSQSFGGRVPNPDLGLTLNALVGKVGTLFREPLTDLYPVSGS